MKLTKTLHKILDFIAKTDANFEEIGKEFNISPHTAKNHEERIRKILAKRSRTQLVIHYYNEIAPLNKGN